VGKGAVSLHCFRSRPYRELGLLALISPDRFDFIPPPALVLFPPPVWVHVLSSLWGMVDSTSLPVEGSLRSYPYRPPFSIW